MLNSSNSVRLGINEMSLVHYIGKIAKTMGFKWTNLTTVLFYEGMYGTMSASKGHLSDLVFLRWLWTSGGTIWGGQKDHEIT